MKFIDNFLEQNKKRIIGLDIIRSIAILLVVYLHGSILLPIECREKYLFVISGLDGVSLFFVLSGFLIGNILLKTIKNTEFQLKDLINFWIRRWFRTLPNYYLILSLLIIYVLIFFKHFDQDISFKYFLFGQNLTSPHPFFFNEAWSLSVEEWFYLSFPIAVYFFYKLLKSKRNSILYATILFIVIPFFLRFLFWFEGIGVSDIERNFREIVIFRLDSLMYGVIAAYLSVYKENLWIKYRKIGLVFSFTLFLFLYIYVKINHKDLFFSAVYRYNVESIATLFLLPFFTNLKKIKNKILSFLFIFISLVSYSMYLIHCSIILTKIIPIIIHFKDMNTILKYCLYWILTFVFSYILYINFEKPITDLRNRLSKE